LDYFEESNNSLFSGRMKWLVDLGWGILKGDQEIKTYWIQKIPGEQSYLLVKK
jgi:hypothetical protein